MSGLNKYYRNEIDVFRAVAVLSVVINHYFPSILPGGFLGVDIFFVISGYLITTHIIAELDSDSFSFINFYKRRIKRILPALYFMLAVTGIISIYLLLPIDLQRFSDSLKATVLYYSNFYFAGHYDYFAQNTKEFPLLHTWSLSVEEQFYFILPLGLYLIFKLSKNKSYRFLFIIFTTLASLILAQMLSTTVQHKNFSYYSLQSRFYELSLGSCAAYYGLKFSYVRVDQVLKKISPILFLIMLVYFFIFSNNATHPGLLSLPLLLSIALLLITPQDSLFFKRISKISPALWFGKISYSLYLWHWPLLALYTYAMYRPEYRHYDKLALLFLSVLLASISYYFIENPLRFNRLNFSRSFILYLLIPSLAFLVLSFVIKNNIGDIAGNNKSKSIFSEDTFLAPEFCYNKKNGQCLIGDISKKPKALLFGDSHAGHYIAVIDEIGKSYGFAVIGISISNCYPLFNSTSNLPAETKKLTVPLCYETINEISRNLDNYSTILLAGRWSSLFDKEYQQIFPFIQQLNETLLLMQKKGKLVIGLPQVPELTEYSFNYSVRRSHIFKEAIKFERSYSEKLGNDQLKSIFLNYSNATVFEYFENNNTDLSGLPFYKNVYIYSDWNHLNEVGGRLLAKDMGPVFIKQYGDFFK